MRTEDTSETFKLVIDILRERGVVAFAIVAVEPDEGNRYTVRASAASMMDETTTEAQAVFQKMIGGVQVVMDDMINGGGRKEYLN